MNIAILIPVHNDERSVFELLSGILRIHDERTGLIKFFIYIYLDNCTDGTLSAITDSAFKDLAISYFDVKERSGKLLAINYLSARVIDKEHTHIVLIDSDINFDPYLFSKFLERNFANNGITVPKNAPKTYKTGGVFYHWASVTFNAYDKLRSNCPGDQLWFISGNLILLPMEAFKKIFPIPTGIINDDAYIGWKNISEQGHLYYDNTFNIFTDYANDLKSFYAQKKRVRTGYKQLIQLGLPVIDLRKKLIAVISRDIIKSKKFYLYAFLLFEIVFFRLILLFTPITKNAGWKRIKK